MPSLSARASMAHSNATVPWTYPGPRNAAAGPVWVKTLIVSVRTFGQAYNSLAGPLSGSAIARNAPTPETPQ